MAATAITQSTTTWETGLANREPAPGPEAPDALYCEGIGSRLRVSGGADVPPGASMARLRPAEAESKAHARTNGWRIRGRHRVPDWQVVDACPYGGCWQARPRREVTCGFTSLLCILRHRVDMNDRRN